jgi:hypothetical protein
VSGARRVEVRCTSYSCPWFHWDDDGSWCQYSERPQVRAVTVLPSDGYGAVPPKWCPLRAGPILVGLAADDGGAGGE